jgi:magnesium chelatase subunit I
MGVFPWSAVLGQERLKLALLLCAVDPAVGGVLVRGPRGVAKTTLARAFAELLPGRFVELPLGATEERVTGSLDLGKALGQGEVQFAPGLLARAHDGVLYVDEVNLLPDALVDLLLDAAATGQNVVERDGVSHVHAARFVLVGTMNPEEGELRPQLLDRFGLSVEADGVLAPAARTEVVLRRLAFERDPDAFAATFAGEQRELIQRCHASRQRARSLPFAGPGVAHAAELCHAAGVDGVRADLAMLRAARAHAAWHEHGEILASDVDAVAELALSHRRRTPSPGSGQPGPGQPSGQGGPGSPRGGPLDRAQAKSTPIARNAPPSASSRPGSGASDGSERAPAAASAQVAGEPAAPAETTPATSPDAGGPRGSNAEQNPGRGPGRGALKPVAVRSSEPSPLPPWFLGFRRPARARAQVPLQRRIRGAHYGGDGAIDWFATLARTLANASRSPSLASSPSSSSAGEGHGEPSRAAERWRAPFALADLRRRPRRLALGGSWVLALDCSASMLHSGALSLAKGVARAIAARGARVTARVALVSFGGLDVRIEVGSTRERGAIGSAIAALGAAGGTPLRRAVQLGLELADPVRPSPDQRFFLFTDGRTREDLAGLASAHPRTQVTVIDCERGPVRLDRTRRLAESLDARYVHVDWLALT